MGDVAGCGCSGVVEELACCALEEVVAWPATVVEICSEVVEGVAGAGNGVVEVVVGDGNAVLLTVVDVVSGAVEDVGDAEGLVLDGTDEVVSSGKLEIVVVLVAKIPPACCATPLAGEA